MRISIKNKTFPAWGAAAFFASACTLTTEVHARMMVLQDSGSATADLRHPSELTASQKLEADQKLLAANYKLLEEKLFSLHEYEKESNPLRSKLLERAFLQSQEKMTASQMKLIVNLLTKKKLKDAENEQQEVLDHLNQLLELLQSEDRGKRVRDEIRMPRKWI